MDGTHSPYEQTLQKISAKNRGGGRHPAQAFRADFYPLNYFKKGDGRGRLVVRPNGGDIRTPRG